MLVTTRLFSDGRKVEKRDCRSKCPVDVSSCYDVMKLGKIVNYPQKNKARLSWQPS